MIDLRYYLKISVFFITKNQKNRIFIKLNIFDVEKNFKIFSTNILKKISQTLSKNH